MGHDISPIGNHTLNTENIELLANDITSRIDINIEYGYFGQKEHFKLLGENREDELIILGKVIKDETFKTFRLLDESYMLKRLYKKFRKQFLKLKKYPLSFVDDFRDIME
ncbi:MAG: hypothetical protein GXO79_11235 [Chlorobi bacterium]|nr:hypothetical protein [Chlorobiota bacterium]